MRAARLFELPSGLEEAGAVLSADGLYRYVLTRAWAEGDLVVWVMLNPSTADDKTDDATIRKCVGFSKTWGMGRLAVVNLYAWRSRHPGALKTAADPVGPENRTAVEEWVGRAHLVVAGWGANATALQKTHPPPPVAEIAASAGKGLMCLGACGDGSPRHPLMPGYDTPLTPWPGH